MASCSPSPSLSSHGSLSARRDVNSHSPSFSPRHRPYHSDAMKLRETDHFELSSHSSNSREPSPNTDSDMSSSDDEDEQGPLPSLGEFWNGRLPSGSGLDTSIRNLGIGQPMPPPRPAATHALPGHGHGRLSRCCAPASSTFQGSRGDCCTMDSRASLSTSAPAHYDNPYRLRRPSPPPKADVWSPRMPTSSSPVYGYPLLRESNVRRSYSVDSDSDDGYRHSVRPSAGPYTLHRTVGRPISQPSSVAGSYDSDMDFPSSRPNSVHGSFVDSRPQAFPGRPSSYFEYGHSECYPMSDSHMTSSNWEDYVEKAGRLNGAGPIMYTCMWRKHEGQVCNYTGKKQLAKRHVESVHLGKKPHVCPSCRKPFPQKTSLDIHIRSVHTFQKPLKCEHCEACFSDPARRHKHYRVEHPDKVVKKTRVKIEYKDIKHLLQK